MSGINPGFAAYLANKKAGNPTKQSSNTSKMSKTLPPAVFHDAPGLPKVGKRHAKVMTASKPC